MTAKTHRHCQRAKPLLALLAAATLVTTLPGCAAFVIGGAFVGGAMVVTDRRTSGAQIDDQAIELRANSRVGELLGDRGHVSVTSYNRLVLLTGEVPTEADKAAAEQTASKVESVRSVVNDLGVTGLSSLSSRSYDSFLSGKVKTSLIDAKDILANAFKVVTERGTVYLMGRVSEREAQRASDVARGVPGVQKVVRVFELLTEAELAALPKAAK